MNEQERKKDNSQHEQGETQFIVEVTTDIEKQVGLGSESVDDS